MMCGFIRDTDKEDDDPLSLDVAALEACYATTYVYNAIGSPLTYDGWTYTWKAGRMLESMTSADTTAQFTYDHTGLRVKKNAGGVDTLYTLNGKKITGIRKGSNHAAGEDAAELHFFYDAQGRPVIARYMDTDYAYLPSLQGDVVGILDMNGTSVVDCTYDAWEMPTYTKGSMAETLGVANPFRYRGVVWDEETGLYELRSRYYNPVWGRFVRKDVILEVIGERLSHNIYLYCNNAPASFFDLDGKIGILATIFGTVRHFFSKITETVNII